MTDIEEPIEEKEPRPMLHDGEPDGKTRDAPDFPGGFKKVFAYNEKMPAASG